MHEPPGTPEHVEVNAFERGAAVEHDDDAVEPGRVELRTYTYVSTGFATLDAAFNGGLANGTVTIVGGPNGSGKTTAVLGWFQNMTGPAGYATAEQSENQVVGLAQRVGATRRGLFVKETTDLDEALAYLTKRRAKKGCLDSLNRFRVKGISAERGSPKMCSAIIERCLEWARANDAILVLISHYTKDGDFAGRADVQHDADLTVRVIKFKSGRRRISVAKSRIGPDDNRRAWFVANKAGAFVEAPAPLVDAPATVHPAPHGDAGVRGAGTGTVDDPAGHDRGRAPGRAASHRRRG